MITFYPGPSKIYPEVAAYMQEACGSGLLSMNHRSAPFMEMLAQTVGMLKAKLHIPEGYEVYFTSSATECWEIVAQSLAGSRSIHLFNGAFGQKWWEYTHRIRSGAVGVAYGLNEQPAGFIPAHDDADILCLTHNETSNGTAIAGPEVKTCRDAFKGLIAVDATSSMGGVQLPWEAADVWFASVQKCFGLPPGLAVLVVSPEALERASGINDRNYYNSLLFIAENFSKNQTPYTPNILGIYLLGKVAGQIRAIDRIHEDVVNRARDWYTFLENHDYVPLVSAPHSRSGTVIAVNAVRAGASGIFTAAIKQFMQERQILLGNGYGQWKEATFRIANFPAILPAEIALLQDCMKEFIDTVQYR